MMHLTRENGWNAQKALQQTKELDFDCSRIPQLKENFESYIDKKSR